MTDLIKRESQQMVEYDPGPLGIPGLEAMDPGDLIVPRYSIVQPTSADKIEKGGRPGHLMSNLSGDCMQKMSIIPLLITKGMVLFEENMAGVACKSNDAILPSPAIEKPYSEQCHRRGPRGGLQPVCNMAQWDGRQKPACAMTFNMVALEADTESPFFVSFKGSSIRPVKGLITSLAKRRTSPFNLCLTMTTERVKGDLGTYYVVLFKDHKLVQPEDKYIDAFKQFRGYDLEKSYTAEATEEESQEGATRSKNWDSEAPHPADSVSDEAIPF